ncbi:MAG: hypothetical protein KKA05_10405 [Alphaproteobacteria bacterium]|nr:hypothetical protein [Alphaproteobacteria bacterium]
MTDNRIPVADLLKALTQCGAVARKKSTVPALASVIVAAWGDRVTLTASNLEVEVSACLDWPGAGHWAALVKLWDFLAIVKGAEKGALVGLSMDSERLCIEIGHGVSHLYSMPPSDLPLFNLGETVGRVVLKSENLAAECKAVAPFMAKAKDCRYQLRGAYLQFLDGGPVRLVATNGAQLAVRDLESLLREGDRSAIVPADAVSLIGKHGPTFGLADVELIEVAERYGRRKLCVRFEFDDVTVTAEAIVGTFPPYALLSGKDETPGAVVSSGELRKAVDLVQSIHGGRGRVKVDLIGSEIRISATDDAGGYGETWIDAQADAGADLSFEIASKAALRALRLLDREEPVRIMAGVSAMTVRSIAQPKREAIVAILVPAIDDPESVTDEEVAAYLESVASSAPDVTMLDPEFIADLERRAGRIEAARDVFSGTAEGEEPWTRKILSLKLCDAVSWSPAATLRSGAAKPVKKLAETRLKQIARQNAASAPPAPVAPHSALVHHRSGPGAFRASLCGSGDALVYVADDREMVTCEACLAAHAGPLADLLALDIIPIAPFLAQRRAAAA